MGRLCRPWCCKAQARTADGSFYCLTSAVPPEGTAASKPCGAEAGHEGQRWWSSRRQCPGSSKSSLGWGEWSQNTSRSMDLQGPWPCVGLPRGMPAQMAMPPPTLIPSRSEGMLSRYSPSLQQHCSAPATRHVCLCHLRQAHGSQDTGAVLAGNTLCLVLEKISQWQRKVSPSLGSSASDHSCHAVEWQG